MHGLGETQAGVRVMCLDKFVAKANPKLCARPEDYKPQVETRVEYRDRVVYRDAPVMAPIPNPPAAKPAPKPRRVAKAKAETREELCDRLCRAPSK